MDLLCTRGGYWWDRNREEAIMGSGWGILGQGKKEQKALGFSGEMGRTLFSRVRSSVPSPGPCPTQAAEHGCRMKSGHVVVGSHVAVTH